MYTRSYSCEEGKMIVPNGYDGTAFEKEEGCETEECLKKCDNGNSELGIFKKFPFLKGFTGLELTKLPFNIGTEELILIGLALLLFFTKDGDRECALMIALLLFIK